jgi:hypothetical protein
MNIDLAPIKEKALVAAAFVRQHFNVITILIIVSIFGFLILRTSQLAQREPSQEAVSERLEKIKRPTLDKQTAEKLRALEDNNQETKALFEAARENPFQE